MPRLGTFTWIKVKPDVRKRGRETLIHVDYTLCAIL